MTVLCHSAVLFSDCELCDFDVYGRFVLTPGIDCNELLSSHSSFRL